MNRNNFVHFVWFGLAFLFVLGMARAPIEKAAASPIRGQLDGDPIVITPISGLITSETGGSAGFTVVLAVQPIADVTIGLSSSDSTEGTVLPITLTFTPADWSVAQTVTVTGVDDLVADGPVAYQIITAAAASGDPIFDLYDPPDVAVTNLDNDVAGITVSKTFGLITTEAGGTDSFTVVLTSQPTADVTIGLSSSDITEGTVAPASLTFTPANWNNAQTVTVTGVDDFVADGSIAYQIITAQATSSDTNYSSINPADVSVTNQDNDVAGITVSKTSGLITTEAGGTDSFTVVLTSQPTADVTIGLSSSDTTEGTVAPASLTFTPANWNTPRTVTVTGVDDPMVDGSVSYNIITAAASSSDTSYNNLNPADVSATNLDNDVAGITVNPTSGLVTNEAAGTANFTVVLTSQPTADVTIGLSSSDTTEGTVAPASLTFTSGNWNTARTVTVTGVDDFVVDGSIAYQIITAQATSSDTNYSSINPADVSVTNQDNDIAGITVNPTSGLITNETGTSVTFTVVLTSQPTGDVTIGLTSSDITEGTVAPTSLTFTSVNWSSTQTVTVTGVNDLIIDGAVAYQVITAAAISSDTNYNGKNAADVSLINQDNDTAGITVNPTLGLTTTETGTTASFTVVLTSQPTADVTIGLTSSDLTEGTVSPASLTFTSANWNSQTTVTVTGVDDLIVDGPIAYQIITAAAVSGDTNYSGINPADVSLTNQDNDVAGITVNPTSGLSTNETGTSATFTVVLTSQPTGDVTIGLSSSDLTEGTVAPASLTFTSGNWNAPRTVTVTGVDDPIVDGPIAYLIVTAQAVSTDTNYSSINPADVSVTNQDNNSAGITVNPTSGLTTTEAAGTASFTIVLTSQPTADVTIGLSSSDLTEGTVAPASLTFTPANWDTPRTVTVTGVDDLVADGAIPYNIVTAAATSTDPIYNTVNPADVSVTNQDNDVAGITVSKTSGLITTEAGGTDSFTIVLTSQPTADVTIGLSSSDTTEGTVAPASLTFTSANWSNPRTVTVTGADDFVADGAIAYQIVTAAATSTDPVYNTINPPDVSATNQDNDVAGITVSKTSGLITTEAGGTDSFTIVLTSQPTADVTIGLTSSDITEGTVAPASLTFTSANWNTARTVTVTGVDDQIVDGAVAYQIVTAAATSSDTNYNGKDAANVAVTNQDNDVAGITVSKTSGLITTEAGGTDSFTMVLTSQPTADVTIGLTSSDTTEGTVAPASLTFTSANWNIARTVTVTGADDFVADGAIAYQIVTAAAASTDPVYNTLNAPDVSVTNQDNDVAGITVSKTSGLITTEAGGADSFTIVLTSQPTADVTIGLSSSDITEGTVAPASLTFTAGNWNTARTVAVTGVDDLVADGSVAYQIVTAAATSTDANYSGKNAADVSVTNQDNDIAGITVIPTSGLNTSEAGGAAEFTLVLTSQPTADVTIGLSSSDTTEGTVAPASLTFTSVNWNTPRTVTVTGVDDLVADGPVAYQVVTAPAASSDLTYNGMNAANVSLTNQDNDTAGTTVNPTSGLVTTEAGGTATFTIVLNTEPTSNVTIGLSSSDTTEAAVSPASLTFTPVNWNTVRTVTVTGVNDPLDDGDQPFTIITANASSLDSIYAGMVVLDVTGINQNDDFTPVAANDSFLTNARPDKPLSIDPPGVLGNDTDANHDLLSASKKDNPQKGLLDLKPNGGFVYTPIQTSTRVETDSFTYWANDGGLDSNLATVNITIDPLIPTVTWMSPVVNGEIFEVTDQYVRLKADASDNYSLDQVHFFRWDAKKNQYVDIAVVSGSPYQVDFDTWTLNYQWNQVFVAAKDGAGNVSPVQFIWIYRNLPLQFFLPMIRR